MCANRFNGMYIKVIVNQTTLKSNLEVNMSNQQPKPDNRQNNVERLHDMIENTERKLQEAEISMEFASPEEREMLKNKNKRRKQSIEAMKEEMLDEMDARKNREI